MTGTQAQAMGYGTSTGCFCDITKRNWTENMDLIGSGSINHKGKGLHIFLRQHFKKEVKVWAVIDASVHGHLQLTSSGFIKVMKSSI